MGLQLFHCQEKRADSDAGDVFKPIEIENQIRWFFRKDRQKLGLETGDGRVIEISVKDESDLILTGRIFILPHINNQITHDFGSGTLIVLNIAKSKPRRLAIFRP